MFEKIWNALQGQIELNVNVRHALIELDDLSRDVSDHEKRLLKIETIMAFARGELGQFKLPGN